MVVEPEHLLILTYLKDIYDWEESSIFIGYTHRCGRLFERSIEYQRTESDRSGISFVEENFRTRHTNPGY